MKEKVFEKKFKALGTDISIEIIAFENLINEASYSFKEIEKIYRRMELIFSRFDPESDVSKLNNNLGKYFEVSPEVLYLVKKSLEYYLKSEKFFDPRILDRLEKIGYKFNFQDNAFNEDEKFSVEIFKKDLVKDIEIIDNNRIRFFEKMDFSGIAKGHITDVTSRWLFSRGWRNFLVDSGGDMYASGLNKYGEKWRIGLEGFKNENEVLAEISNEGIATSGNTRRKWEIKEKKFHHLINPHNLEEFDFGLKSVTVIARTTMEADVLAKVLFLMGLERGLNFANKNEIKSIFLKSNKEIIKSNNLN